MRRLAFAVALLVAVACTFHVPTSSSSLLVAVEGARVCPPGVPTAFCFADPCRANDCALGCESDYCGGCHARCRCRRDSDCSGGERCKRDEADAATGLCMPTTTGSPGAEDDTNKNEGATVDKKCMTVRCNSDTTCVKGACVPRKCSTNSDCSERAFCSTEGKCLSQGSCTVPADCPAQGWSPMIKCIGHFTCGEEGHCGYACGRIIPPGRGRGRGRGRGLGLGGGLGGALGNNNDDAQHKQETDEGAATSTSTTTTTTTTPPSSSPPASQDGDRAPPPPLYGCQSNEECDGRSYCGSRGACVQRGQCDVPADCPHDPSFMHIMCAPGVFSCSADGQCGYRCGTALSP